MLESIITIDTNFYIERNKFPSKIISIAPKIKDNSSIAPKIKDNSSIAPKIKDNSQIVEYPEIGHRKLIIRNGYRPTFSNGNFGRQSKKDCREIVFRYRIPKN